MSTILEKSNSILTEKNAKILPENIKKDLQVFDVTGTLEELKGQEKTVTPTTEQQVITPDEGFNGITKLIVEASAGNGSIKQFATIEEMEADTTIKEGDLALVYGQEISTVNSASTFTELIFPETVTLAEAYTSSGYVYIMDEQQSYETQCQVRMSSTYFYIRDYYTYEYIVRYTSTDGITYVLDSGYSTSHTFSQSMHFEGTWDDNLSAFMKAKINTLTGLYSYISYKDETELRLIPINNISKTDSKIEFIEDETLDIYKLDTLKAIAKKIQEDKIDSSTTALMLMKINGILAFGYEYITHNGTTYQTALYPYTSNNSTVTGLASSKALSSSYTVSAYIRYFPIDIENQTYTGEKTLAPSSTVTYNSNIRSIYTGITHIGITLNAAYNISPLRIINSDGSENGLESTYEAYVTKYRWDFAPTQLSLSASNELLPGKVAYGNKGIIIGDGSVYDNLDKGMILTNIFNLNKMETAEAYDGIPQHYYRFTRAAKDDGTAAELKYYKRTNNFKDYVSHDADKKSLVLINKEDVVVFDTARTYNTNKTMYYMASNKQILVYNSNDELLHTFDGQVLHFHNDTIYYSSLYLNASKDTTSANTIYTYDLNTDTNTAIGTIPSWTGYDESLNSYNFKVMMNYIIIIKHGLTGTTRRFHLYAVNIDTNVFIDLGNFTLTNSKDIYKYGCGVQWVTNSDEIIVIFSEYTNQLYKVYKLENDTLVLKTTMTFSGSFEYFTGNGEIGVMWSNAYKLTDGTNRYMLRNAYRSILIDFDNSVASRAGSTRWYKDNVYLEDGYDASAYIYARKWRNKLFANYNLDCEVTNVTTETIDGTTYQRFDITETDTINAYNGVYLRAAVQEFSGGYYVNENAYIMLEEDSNSLLCNGKRLMPKDGFTIDLDDKTYITCSSDDPELEVIAIETNTSDGSSAENLLLFREPNV